MKLNEIYQAINLFVESLPEIFNDVKIDFPLKDKTNPIGDWSDSENMGMVVTSDGIGTNSGVYFFAKPDGTVFYIGKAGNIHGRVWSHVNTPDKNSTETLKFFSDHTFSCENAEEEIESVKSGKALLGVATVSNPDVVALIEVYLQTLHIKKLGKLSAINKQIG